MMQLLKKYTFRSNLTNHKKLMFWSACTPAFFGFLRSSEYVSTSASNYSKHRTLLHRDVRIKKGRIHLIIKASNIRPISRRCHPGNCSNPSQHLSCSCTEKISGEITLPLWSPIQAQEWQVPDTPRGIQTNQKGCEKEWYKSKAVLFSLVPYRCSLNSCSSWYLRFHDQVTWTLTK